MKRNTKRMTQPTGAVAMIIGVLVFTVSLVATALGGQPTPAPWHTAEMTTELGVVNAFAHVNASGTKLSKLAAGTIDPASPGAAAGVRQHLRGAAENLERVNLPEGAPQELAQRLADAKHMQRYYTEAAGNAVDLFDQGDREDAAALVEREVRAAADELAATLHEIVREQSRALDRSRVQSETTIGGLLLNCIALGLDQCSRG